MTEEIITKRKEKEMNPLEKTTEKSIDWSKADPIEALPMIGLFKYMYNTMRKTGKGLRYMGSRELEECVFPLYQAAITITPLAAYLEYCT